LEDDNAAQDFAVPEHGEVFEKSQHRFSIMLLGFLNAKGAIGPRVK